MKKGCIIAAIVAAVVAIPVVLIVLFVVGVIGTAIHATSDVVAAGDTFIEQVGSGQLDSAYTAHTSAAFQSEVSREEFGMHMAGMRLTEAASASWNSRSINNAEGSLAGKVTLDDGSTIPVELALVKESGAWRVVSIDVNGSSAATGPPPAMPEPREIKALLESTMLSFAEGVRLRDFTKFHSQLSSAFRELYSVDALTANFAQFVDQQIDVSVVQGLDPVFDSPPTMNAGGVLFLKGHYSTQPSALSFDFQYVKEDGLWRLQLIKLDAARVEGG